MYTSFHILLKLIRSQRLLVRAGVLLIGTGLVIVGFANNLDLDFMFGYRRDPFSRLMLMFGFTLAGAGMGFLMFQYLRGDTLRNTENAAMSEIRSATDDSPISVLREEVRTLTGEVASLKSVQLDALAGNQQELIEALRPTIHAGVADELEERFKQRLSQTARDKEILAAFTTAELRLQNELGALGRRSNLNLVIGVLTTSLAVGLLAYMVLGIETRFTDITTLLSHYIPRLGLVLFIEIFSFFFLRLYRTTLAEMRMYQTDLTGLTIQRIAVVAALSTGEPAGATALSKELLASKPVVSLDQTATNSKEVDQKVLAELVQAISKVLTTKGKDA